MVAGHLAERKGRYYAVINYNDDDGKRNTKWISLGLPVKGNKKRAETKLMEIRKTFTIPSLFEDFDESMLFSDFLTEWLKIIKGTVTLTTYSSYCSMADVIKPFFRRRKITLERLRPKDIQLFYMEQLDRVKASTVIHYHAVIHRALKYAVKIELISSNPADKVERPKKQPFLASYYDSEEINKLLAASKGTMLEIPIMLAAFYGLRRGEVIGLKWSAVDFEQNTITINHTVSVANLDGQRQLVQKDSAKTKSSMRTLPLVDFVKKRLIELAEEQQRFKELCGRSYTTKYEEYICVDQLGYLISPDYVTRHFKVFLAENNLREIRFHDLRHSCASMLLANGVQMKQIQEWLGHSDFSTTANIYAHLDYSSKISSASAMLSGLGIAE